MDPATIGCSEYYPIESTGQETANATSFGIILLTAKVYTYIYIHIYKYIRNKYIYIIYIYIYLFLPLRPFFHAALAKRWKVQFCKGLRKFNNVNSKTTYFNENCCIIYIYIYTYIGRLFLNLLHKHFHKELILNVIFKQNSITLSYGCT